jgi:hypothetical protein
VRNTPHANSPSPEFALEIAPPIHSGHAGNGLIGIATLVLVVVLHWLAFLPGDHRDIVDTENFFLDAENLA